MLGNRVVVPAYALLNYSGGLLAQGNWMQAGTGFSLFVLNGTAVAKCVLRDNHFTSPSKGGYVQAGAHDNRIVENVFLGAGNDIDSTGAGSGNVLTPNY